MEIMPNHDFFLILFATTLTNSLVNTNSFYANLNNTQFEKGSHSSFTMKLLLSENMISGSS